MANYSPQAKPNLLTVFVNKALTEHSHMHSFVYRRGLLLYHDGKIAVQKPQCSQTLKHYCLTPKENLCQPLLCSMTTRLVLL